MNAQPASPDDVLVIAGRLGIAGLSVADGSLLWEHSKAKGWPVIGVPLVARLDGGVVCVAASSKLAFLRVVDGAILGQDEVWFMIERVVQHGTSLVVHGTGGLACYRNGVRTWGLIGLKEDPNALLLTDYIAWTSDAHGRPVKPAGAINTHEAAALLLGSSVTQIDRTHH
jgi:hypothetical protein